MNTVFDLVNDYNPRRVIIWDGEETLYDGNADVLIKIVSKHLEWVRYEYFKDKGELIIKLEALQ